MKYKNRQLRFEIVGVSDGNYVDQVSPADIFHDLVFAPWDGAIWFLLLPSKFYWDLSYQPHGSRPPFSSLRMATM